MILKFKYKNHRGEERMRTVNVRSLDFITRPGFGYQPGWFLTGVDEEKNVIRSFSLHNIILDQPSEMIYRLVLS